MLFYILLTTEIINRDHKDLLYFNFFHLKKALAILQIGVNMYLSTQVVRMVIMYLDRNGNLRAQIVSAIQNDIFTNRKAGDKLPSETEGV